MDVIQRYDNKSNYKVIYYSITFLSSNMQSIFQIPDQCFPFEDKMWAICLIHKKKKFIFS